MGVSFIGVHVVYTCVMSGCLVGVSVMGVSITGVHVVYTCVMSGCVMGVSVMGVSFMCPCCV